MKKKKKMSKGKLRKILKRYVEGLKEKQYYLPREEEIGIGWTFFLFLLSLFSYGIVVGYAYLYAKEKGII